MSAVEQCSRPRGTMTNCNISPINFIFMHSIVKIIIYYTWLGLDKLCQHNFENNRYSQECENNAGIIGKAFCLYNRKH